MSQQRCRECKELVPGGIGTLRAHWVRFHNEKLEAMSRYFADQDAKVRGCEELAAEGMIGVQEGSAE